MKILLRSIARKRKIGAEPLPSGSFQPQPKQVQQELTRAGTDPAQLKINLETYSTWIKSIRGPKKEHESPASGESTWSPLLRVGEAQT